MTQSRVRSPDGTEIAYWTSGEGPPRLLVHGAPADHTRWRPLLPYLEPHFTVQVMDRRGRGESGDEPEYDIAREYEDVAAVVDAVAEATESKSDADSRSGEAKGDRQNDVVTSRVLYLVGGAPRVGKSSPAQRLLKAEGVPCLSTDVVRTVLHRVLSELDALDQDPVDAVLLAEFMYPHIEQAAEVCVEEAEHFLIEGFELSAA